MWTMGKRLFVVATLAAIGIGPAQAQDRIKVVATISILGDLVKEVGGDRVEVATLVGHDADAHVFSPTPADARKLSGAKAVVINGLGLEGWITRLLRSSGTRAQTITATTGIKPRRAEDGGHGHDHAVDPHAWQSVANAKIYVGNVRDGLIKADPSGEPVYTARAKEYLQQLDALEREVRETVAKIPADRRKVITTHDAFGYFAAAYGIAFIAPVGVSSEAEPSARDLARIIVQIRRQTIPAVFLENISDPRMMEQIARETGAWIGGTLYSDALSGPEGPAPTYVAMMRHNLGELSKALVP